MPETHPLNFSDLEAILFDMDGTLVDSTEAVVRSWRAWAERRGLAPQPVVDVCHGRPARDTIRHFAPAADQQVEYDFVLQEELKDGGVVPIAGAIELLTALNASGARWGIVTSADDRLARHRIRQAGLPMPSVLVTVDRVRRGKPDPEGYLLGASLLGVLPKACLVVEDTPIGLQAGLAAGMRVLAIGHTFPRAELPAPHAIADWRGVRWQPSSLDISNASLLAASINKP